MRRGRTIQWTMVAIVALEETGGGGDGRRAERRKGERGLGDGTKVVKGALLPRVILLGLLKMGSGRFLLVSCLTWRMGAAGIDWA